MSLRALQIRIQKEWKWCTGFIRERFYKMLNKYLFKLLLNFSYVSIGLFLMYSGTFDETFTVSFV